LRHETNQEALIYFLGYVGPEEQLEDEYDIRRDLVCISNEEDLQRQRRSGRRTVRRFVWKVSKPIARN
jgi:hypothetical protein